MRLIYRKEARMTRKRDFKREVIIADLHSGHRVGLTPPDWHYQGVFAKGTTTNKISRIQREMWKFYSEAIDKLKPIDGLIVNGDAIDGKGERTGSSEQAVSDRNEQCEMAAECINYAEADRVLMTYGTPYHTGNEEDWEDVVAGKVKNLIKIGGQEWPEINGVIFDVKHKVSGSTVPHGRMTALARAKLWNQIWHAEHGQQPKADVLIRSHVHYHVYCGGPGWLAMTTPALQGFGSKFGVRQCEGLVDIGLIVFDIKSNGETKWDFIEGRVPHTVSPSLTF